MQTPPEITVRDVEMTPFLEGLITRGIARLEKVCDYIISVRVALEKAQSRHQTGNPYRMRIYIIVPGRPEIVVDRFSKASTDIPDGLTQIQAQLASSGVTEPKRLPLIRRSPIQRRGVREEPLSALIRRTFTTARRDLAKMVEKQRGEVKTGAQQEMQAVIEKLFRGKDYGFLRTQDGQQVYFHKNSVLHKHWESLAVGTIVRYTPELGEKGLQASTVEPVDKPGAVEMHDRLHDLQSVTAR